MGNMSCCCQPSIPTIYLRRHVYINDGMTKEYFYNTYLKNMGKTKSDFLKYIADMGIDTSKFSIYISNNGYGVPSWYTKTYFRKDGTLWKDDGMGKIPPDVYASLTVGRHIIYYLADETIFEDNGIRPIPTEITKNIIGILLEKNIREEPVAWNA